MSLKKLPNKKARVGSDVKPSDLAFVNYTSGTTGRPKGILIEHQSIVTSLVTYTKDIAYAPETRVLQYASYTFDVSISEILCALAEWRVPLRALRGGAHERHRGRHQQVQCHPGRHYPDSCDALHPAQVPTLKTLTVGGEALTRDAMNIWAGHVNLINAYGPS